MASLLTHTMTLNDFLHRHSIPTAPTWFHVCLQFKYYSVAILAWSWLGNTDIFDIVELRHVYTHTHTHTHICIYIYIYIYRSIHNDAIQKHRSTRKSPHPDGDTDYINIVAGVLQGDTLAPYLFIISLGNLLRTSMDKMKENDFKLTKEISRMYPAQTITDADCTDDTVILSNTPAQAETLLHSLERAAAGIGLHVNAHKIE